MNLQQFSDAQINRRRYNSLVEFRQQIEQAYEHPEKECVINFSLIPSIYDKDKGKGHIKSTSETEAKALLKPILDYCFCRELEINQEFKEI